jgi:hypothetical protein
VSISRNNPFQIVIYFRSLVIPGMASVRASLYPTIMLNSVDLPQLGNPISDTVNTLLNVFVGVPGGGNSFTF